MRLTLEPGEQCVIIRETRNGSGTGSITRTTIERVGKRDVVCANGERFNKDRLQRSNGDWSTPTLLLHPDDPRVARVMAANALSSRITRISNVIDVAVRQLRDRNPDEAVRLLREAADL